jgi:hypothetical protein
VGCGFQAFGINGLKLVDQTGASWNRVVAWLWRVDGVIEMPARALTPERANQKSR